MRGAPVRLAGTTYGTPPARLCWGWAEAGLGLEARACAGAWAGAWSGAWAGANAGSGAASVSAESADSRAQRTRVNLAPGGRPCVVAKKNIDFQEFVFGNEKFAIVLCLGTTHVVRAMGGEMKMI